MTDAWKTEDINVLDLDTRAHNCLRRAGLNTLGVLYGQDLEQIRECGKTTARRIREAFARYIDNYVEPTPESEPVELSVKIRPTEHFIIFTEKRPTDVFNYVTHKSAELRYSHPMVDFDVFRSGNFEVHVYKDGTKPIFYVNGEVQPYLAGHK